MKKTYEWNRWITLFMNPDSMEFKSTMFLPNSTITTGQLCPDQRRMPQIVSFLSVQYKLMTTIITDH